MSKRKKEKYEIGTKESPCPLCANSGMFYDPTNGVTSECEYCPNGNEEMYLTKLGVNLYE